MSSSEKCILGTNHAINYHRKEGVHFIYGVFFRPFAVIGAAVSHPRPERGRETALFLRNKELVYDPVYRSCYAQKARSRNVGNAVAGWGTFVIFYILFVAI